MTEFILLTHILIALAGLATSLTSALAPSRTRLRASWCLVVLTLASGTYLVVSRQAGLTAACLTGLAYLAVCLAGLATGRWRLAKATQI